jgi:rubrerythrin
VSDAPEAGSGRPVHELAESGMSAGELLAHAYAMEAEAAERYSELADQMAMHNNHEVAEVFAKLATIEQKHAEQLAERAGELGAARRAPWDYRWLDPESPEAVPLAEVHYLMTAHHALRLALHNELRAEAFYHVMVERADSDEVRALAEEFVAEEQEHVALVRHWLNKFPEPPAGWDEDQDPPVGK